MDKLILEIVKDLAWPVTSIIIVLILKNPISLLLKRLSKFRHGDWELDFERGLENAQAKAKNITYDQPKEEEEEDIEVTQIIEKAKGILTVDPNSAIVFVWSELELAIKEAMEQANVVLPEHFSSLKYLNLLAEHKILDREKVSHLHELRKLRNSAVHIADSSVEVTEYQGLAYIELAKRMYNYLKRYKIS